MVKRKSFLAKLIAICLVFVLAFSSSITAFAAGAQADETSYTVTFMDTDGKTVYKRYLVPVGEKIMIHENPEWFSNAWECSVDHKTYTAGDLYEVNELEYDDEIIFYALSDRDGVSAIRMDVLGKFLTSWLIYLIVSTVVNNKYAF